jgi:hypothetical protein
MAGGIDISAGAAASLASGVGVLVTTGVAQSNAALPNATPGPYTPTNRKAVYSILVPAQTLNNNGNGVGSSGSTNANGITTFSVGAQASSLYVFDAVPRANHDWALNLSEFPLQTGQNVTYNAVLKQPIFTIEVSMSDAIAAYQQGMWVGNASKSISAFLTMLNLIQNRVLVTVSTRYYTYQNSMLIGIQAPEDFTTFAGAKMRLTFKQLSLVTVASQTISARPNATGSTQLGAVQPQAVTPSSQATSQLPSPYTGLSLDDLENQYGTPVSPGSWSSNPTATIQSTLGAGNP